MQCVGTGIWALVNGAERRGGPAVYSTLDMHRVLTGLPPPHHPIPTQLKHLYPFPPPGHSPPSHSYDNSSLLLLQQGAEHTSGVLVPLWLQQNPLPEGQRVVVPKTPSIINQNLRAGRTSGAVDTPGTYEDSGVHLREGYSALPA